MRLSRRFSSRPLQNASGVTFLIPATPPLARPDPYPSSLPPSSYHNTSQEVARQPPRVSTQTSTQQTPPNPNSGPGGRRPIPRSFWLICTTRLQLRRQVGELASADAGVLPGWPEGPVLIFLGE